MIGPVTTAKHPEFTREYDPKQDVWYARLTADAAQVTDTDLVSLCDDFGQGFTRYYSLKVLSEARKTGGKVCLLFREQDPDPCAIMPYRAEPSMLGAFMSEHNPKLQTLIGSVLADMNRPNP